MRRKTLAGLSAAAMSALAGGAAVALLAAGPAAAQARWELLGSRQVGFQVDRETIGARHEGSFVGLRICVARNAVQFRDLDVRFANGERQDLPINRLVRPGTCTPVLDLAGNQRRINEVVMRYNAVPSLRGFATVSLYGLHPPRGMDPRPGPGPGPRPGAWDTIGSRTVGFAVDRDSISGRGEGRFRAVRLCVARTGVTFRDVTVVFGNGERQDLPVRRFVTAGSCTQPFNLSGDARMIREVSMVYNARPNFRGQAVVTLQGMH